MSSLIHTSAGSAIGPDTAAADGVDVVVIGAGLAGASTASVLARQGRSVALIDTHAVCPPEFRAEKLGDVHMEMFGRLGVYEAAKRVMTQVDRVAVYRFGKFVGLDHHMEYSFAYSSLITSLRSALPRQVQFVVGRVTDIATTADRQSVTLGTGRTITARLVVIATGHGEAIRRKVGITSVELRHAHSLSLGFNLGRSRTSFPFESLTFYGSGKADRIAYITLFPIGESMRANLFVYREAGEAWTRRFRQAPNETLRETMPDLEATVGPLDIEGSVDVRPIHLGSAEGYRREGVVLIGDAFCITCPIPGTGVQKVLTDVERLCLEHVPRWFASDGMDAAKIGQFYDDPVKQASDARGIRFSHYSRSIAVDPGLVWMARRLRNVIVRRGMIWARAQGHALAALSRLPWALKQHIAAE